MRRSWIRLSPKHLVRGHRGIDRSQNAHCTVLCLSIPRFYMHSLSTMFSHSDLVWLSNRNHYAHQPKSKQQREQFEISQVCHFQAYKLFFATERLIAIMLRFTTFILHFILPVDIASARAATTQVKALESDPPPPNTQTCAGKPYTSGWAFYSTTIIVPYADGVGCEAVRNHLIVTIGDVSSPRPPLQSCDVTPGGQYASRIQGRD